MLASVSESRVEELRGEGVGASRVTMASQRPHLRLHRCEQRPALRGGVPVGKGAEDQGEVREEARVLHVDDQGAVCRGEERQRRVARERAAVHRGAPAPEREQLHPPEIVGGRWPRERGRQLRQLAAVRAQTQARGDGVAEVVVRVRVGASLVWVGVAPGREQRHQRVPCLEQPHPLAGRRVESRRGAGARDMHLLPRRLLQLLLPRLLAQVVLRKLLRVPPLACRRESGWV